MSDRQITKHVLSALVENKPGVLTRITGLIARRGFNIDSLSVGPTEDPTKSRITIIVVADELSYEQITKQLNKLISVHKITDLTNEQFIERELVLFKVNAPSEKRSETFTLGASSTSISDFGRLVHLCIPCEMAISVIASIADKGRI